MVVREEANARGRKVVLFEAADDPRTRIRAFVTEGAVRIKSAFVGEERRGKGLGTALYEEAVRYAHTRGLRLESDEFVSADAVRVWAALKRRGHNVVRHEATADSEGGLNAVQDKGPVFSIPPAPGGVANASRPPGPEGSMPATHAPETPPAADPPAGG